MGTTEEAITLKIIIIGMVALFLLSFSVILFFIVYQRRLLAQQKKHQKIASDYQKELLRTSILSQEEERTRIAKELHDDIGAMLTTSKLYFGQMNQEIPKEEFNQIKEKMNRFLDDTIHSVRRISQDLRPVILEKLGLTEALESLVKVINETGKIYIDFDYHPNIRIAKSKEHNLYRIIQELITNTLKHARASEIKIELTTDANILVILYQDNGIGFDAKTIQTHKGLGLKNIESRLSVLSGTIEFLNTPSGAKIKLKIP